MMSRLITFILALTALIPSAFARTLAEKGDSAYARQEYRLAIDLYGQSLAREGASPSAYFNLGNAHYRTGSLGRAVLGYERALRLDPGNDDYRANLAFVRSKIQDLPEDDRSFLARLYDQAVEAHRADTWAIWTLVAFALFLVAVVVYVFGQSVWVRKVGFFGGIGLLLVSGAFIIVSLDAAARATGHDEAIVTAPTTFLSSAPRGAEGGGGHSTVAVHEGTKLRIIDSLATPQDIASPLYYDVCLGGNTRAWVRSTDVERI